MAAVHGGDSRLGRAVCSGGQTGPCPSVWLAGGGQVLGRPGLCCHPFGQCTPWLRCTAWGHAAAMEREATPGWLGVGRGMRTLRIWGTLPTAPNFRSLPPSPLISFVPPPHPCHACPFGAGMVGWHGRKGAWLRHAKAECPLGSWWPGWARRGAWDKMSIFGGCRPFQALIPAPLDSSLQGLSIGTGVRCCTPRTVAPASDQYKGSSPLLSPFPPPLLSPSFLSPPFFLPPPSPFPLFYSHERTQPCYNEPQQTPQQCMPHTNTRPVTAAHGRCGRASVAVVIWWL